MTVPSFLSINFLSDSFFYLPKLQRQYREILCTLYSVFCVSSVLFSQLMNRYHIILWTKSLYSIYIVSVQSLPPGPESQPRYRICLVFLPSRTLLDDKSLSDLVCCWWLCQIRNVLVKCFIEGPTTWSWFKVCLRLCVWGIKTGGQRPFCHILSRVWRYPVTDENPDFLGYVEFLYEKVSSCLPHSVLCSLKRGTHLHIWRNGTIFPSSRKQYLQGHRCF